MLPTSSSLVASEYVVMTAFRAISGDEVGIMTTFDLKWSDKLTPLPMAIGQHLVNS